jgi:hypothetical protein
MKPRLNVTTVPIGSNGGQIDAIRAKLFSRPRLYLELARPANDETQN